MIPCPRPECAEETKDGLLCHVDAANLKNRLRHLPDTFRELEITLTRQAKTTAGGGPKARETPLPFDLNASEVRTDTINTVTTWIRDLVETYCDTEDPGTTMTAWCQWLVARMYRIRGHQAGPELWDELMYATSRVMRAIDRPPGRVYVCMCAVCGQPVFGREDREEVECQACRRVVGPPTEDTPTQVPTYRLADEHARRISALRGALLPAEDVHVAVESLLHRRIKYRTLRSWIWRGRLVQRGQDTEGKPLYSVDDALRLANTVAA